MNNWMVFDGNDMPSRMLNVRQVINNDARHRDIGAVISYSKHGLAMQIAKKILEGEDFFSIKEIKTEGFIEISGSCVVLTAEEYRNVMQDQFLKGRDCGMGMMRPHDVKG